MPKVTFILGLSGSGKTHLSEQLKRETGAEIFANLLSDDSGLSALIERLRHGEDGIVDEVRFCLPAYREQSHSSDKQRRPGRTFGYKPPVTPSLYLPRQC